MLTHIGAVNFRDDHRLFGLKESDRLLHLYLIGKTGVGKSTLLSFMTRNDARLSKGFCLIDPHGDLALSLHEALKETRHRYLDLTDQNCTLGYNPLKAVSRDRIPLAVSGFLDVLRSAWSDAWGVRMEHILRNALYALMETKGTTLSDILRLFTDKEFRFEVAKNLKNDAVKAFWLHEYEGYSPGYRQDGIAAIQNKVGAFLADPLLKRVLTNPKEDISLRAVMDEGSILLVNLGKGRIGSDSANLLGGLLVTSLGLAAFSRANQREEDRKSFYLYVDEFQNFTTLSLVSMLSELRKYRLGMIFAHQYVHQLRSEIQHAIFGNVASIIVFRVGAEDAPILAKELYGSVGEDDLLWLPNTQFYAKLAIDGEPSKVFSGKTVRGAEHPEKNPHPAQTAGYHAIPHTDDAP